MARILVVEDDADQLAIRRLLLEAAGHRVIEAQSAEEADRRALDSSPQAVLMDLRLPRIGDGLALVWRLGGLVPVIVLTGADRSVTDGLHVFRALQKPCRSEVLLDTIAAAVSESTSKRTVFLADPAVLEHRTGAGHPERPERLQAVLGGLAGCELTETVPRAATPDELAAVHTRQYLATVEHDVLSGAPELSTGDTSICPESLEAAQRAAGLALSAVDLVAGAHARNAFCAVRPPGHHATASRGMGFCLFNNVAVAARYAQKRHGIERALIADWDVHHGNGTQDIFYADGSVLFFSTHQHPWYPGTGMADETGDGPGEGTTINRPFPAGTGAETILEAFRSALEPAVARFRPEMIFISAGFDSRAGDPLGRFLLQDEDFSALTLFLMELADQYCAGRLISVLEGGYSLTGLTQAVRAHAAALQGRGVDLARR